MYTAHITIMPLTELLDPQGKAVQESCSRLQLGAIKDVRIGKKITLQIDAASAQEAEQIAKTACEKMLYNAVMEQYSIEIVTA